MSQDQSPEVEQAEHQLQESEKQVQDELGGLQDRFLRLGAEFENFKKRAERERQISIKFAVESLLMDLLPVMDHLEQAISVGPESSNDAILTGVKMVLKQFEDTLGKYGVKRFSALGEAFDPSKHEAVAQQESEDTPAGQVITEYQKGYFLHDRLVRPARVVVSK